MKLDLPPGHELLKPSYSLRERIVVASCVGYLTFSVAVLLEVFTPAWWQPAGLLLLPLFIVALLEKP
jgi:hypothetical protein